MLAMLRTTTLLCQKKKKRLQSVLILFWTRCPFISEITLAVPNARNFHGVVNFTSLVVLRVISVMRTHNRRCFGFLLDISVMATKGAAVVLSASVYGRLRLCFYRVPWTQGIKRSLPLHLLVKWNQQERAWDGLKNGKIILLYGVYVMHSKLH